MGRRLTVWGLGITYLPRLCGGLVRFVKMKVCNLPEASCKGDVDNTNIYGASFLPILIHRSMLRDSKVVLRDTFALIARVFRLSLSL